MTLSYKTKLSMVIIAMISDVTRGKGIMEFVKFRNLKHIVNLHNAVKSFKSSMVEVQLLQVWCKTMWISGFGSANHQVQYSPEDNWSMLIETLSR